MGTDRDDHLLNGLRSAEATYRPPLAEPTNGTPVPPDSAQPSSDKFIPTATRLAALQEYEYDGVRLAEAKRLGVKVGTLDTAVKALREPTGDDLQGSAISWPEPDPWDDPVDGAAMLSELSEVIGRYVQMSDPLADAVALWVTSTWLHHGLDISTFLSVQSATKRCGKSLLLEIISEFVYRDMLISGRVTSAPLFRIIERDAPTILIDEIDTFFGDDDDLRGLINGSQRRKGAQLMRCVGDDHEPRYFTTWCAKALCGIGQLPDTVADRSLSIRLERRPSGPTVPLWRDRDQATIESLQRRIARWVADNTEAVLKARKEVAFPVGLNDRARDAWEALLALAHTGGGVWGGEGGRAWKACQHINEDTEDETDVREKLLADLRTVFSDAGDPSALPTQAILWMPCAKWKDGPGPNGGAVIRLHHGGCPIVLRMFKVRPTTVRLASDKIQRVQVRRPFARVERLWGYSSRYAVTT